MRELSVKAYTASIASFHQSIIHKSFSSQTLGKQGWAVSRQSESGCSSGCGGGACGGAGRQRDNQPSMRQIESGRRRTGAKVSLIEGELGAGSGKSSGPKQD